MRLKFHLLAAPGGIVLLLCFVLPVGVLFGVGFFDPQFTTEHFARLFRSKAYLSVFSHTLLVSATVTLACLLLGYPFAAYLVFQSKKSQYIWLFLVLVPMWMSILIRSYAWMVVLGREGVINDVSMALGITSAPMKLLYTSGAVYLAMIQIMLPLMIVTCYSAMTQVDLTLLRAARVLGASRLKAFLGVFVPLTLHGAFNGSAVVFVLSLGFFVTPALIGGRRDAMIANTISNLIAQADWGFASAIAVVLLVAVALILWLFRIAARPFMYSAN